MESTISLVATQDQHVECEVDVKDLLIRAHPLGGRRGWKWYPSSVQVVPGCLAVASRGGEMYDQDGIPEVYLPGETVTRPGWAGGDWFVAVLAQYPGTVTVQATQKLAGLSQSNSDLAVARFLYMLRLEDPIKLLSREPQWQDSGETARKEKPSRESGVARLRDKVTGLVKNEVEAGMRDRIQLWSHPDIREVAGSLFSRLDNTLRAWGLRVESVSANRMYPSSLYEIALQFKAVEKYLLDAEVQDKRILMEKLGLRDADLADVRTYSEGGRRTGAGLFRLARERREHINAFVELLEQRSVLEAAIFLDDIYSARDKYSAQTLELTEQVLLSAFRYPMLGLGEWGDTEQSMVDASRYHQIEGQWSIPPR